MIVLIPDLHSERAESGETRPAVVLGFHRHAEVGHARLGFAVEPVGRVDDAGDRFDVELVVAVVARSDEGVRDVAVGARVVVDRRNLRQGNNAQWKDAFVY